MSHARRIIWQPQPKQVDFMSRLEYEVLYGGAAGGGKSDALLAEGLRQVQIPHYRGIIFRRTFPQLTDLIDRSSIIYKTAYKGAKYNDNKHVWTFPSGAKVFFGAMQHEKDRKNYQGKQYDFVGFDELTHFTWQQYSYMFSRNRPSGPNTTVYIRATTNPGGVGHAWVKSRFIDPFKPYESYAGEVDIVKPDGQLMRLVKYRTFINSSVFDNKILLQNDPSYLASLGMLSEAERDALLYGNWNSFQGQAFPEFRDDPDHYIDAKFTHVINSFDIPKTWRRFRCMDWGYAKPYSIAWYAIDHDGMMYRYRELYGCTGEPNVGVRQHPREVAKQVKEIENTFERGNHITGYADPSIFEKGHGESIAEQFESVGVYFDPADNNRLSGKMQVHYRLAFDNDGLPMCYVFRDQNPHFIRTFPSQVYSQTKVEDVDTDGEDHIYDEFRYMCSMNPIRARKNVLSPNLPYNPLVDYSNVEEFKQRHRVFMNL